MHCLPLEPGPTGIHKSRFLFNGNSNGTPFSPDGRWIAYTSTESSTPDTVIQRWVNNRLEGPPIPVSDEPGNRGGWVRGQSAVSYVSKGVLMKVPVRTEPKVIISESERIIDMSELNVSEVVWLPDGRLIGTQLAPVEYEPGRISVVQNFFEELKRQVAAAQ